MSLTGYCQTGKGRIKGNVVDDATHKPVEFAAVVVTDQQTQKVVTGATTEASGAFMIKDVPAGLYSVTIEFIGYKRDTISNVVISQAANEVKLNTISLRSSQHTLKDVTITAALPVVENKIDKIVYNVANDVTSQGGVALDVLKKVPQVGVDIDGNVDIQGNGNIRFLINGKPSSVFNSPVDALSAIPASQIKSIEVISSPGAKYDAEGTGGIINIILKENKMQGVNGNVTLSVGTRLENTSLNLGVKHGNFGVNAYFSGNAQLISRTPNLQNRTSSDSLHLNQNGYTDLQRQGLQSGIGFDWNVTKHDNLTANIGYNYLANRNTNFYNQDQYTQNPNQGATNDVSGFRNSDSRFQNNSVELSLAYKKTFKKEGQELNILYSASLGNPVSDYTLYQTYTGTNRPYSGSESHSPGTDRETDIAADYTQPVNKNLVLETGIKTTLQNIHSIADVGVLDSGSQRFVPDNTQSYTLTYDRKIYAGYISASLGTRQIKIKPGLRFEHTDNSIDLLNTTIPSYDLWVPSIIIMHEFKNDQSIKLSYSHRIERPNYQLLNPFVNRSDPYNITTGNPLLKPEIGDNIELGYNKSFGKTGNIAVTLFERMDLQDQKPVTNLYPTYAVGDSVYENVSVTDVQNIGKEYNTGVTLYASVNIKEKLNLHFFTLAAQRFIESSLAANGVAIGYRFRFNLNGSYQLPHDLVAEAFANYNSASENLQGRTPQSLTYTIAGRKQFWNKNASIGITATNIFSKYINQVTTINTSSYISYNVRELPYRSVGISFTYKFGKLEFKKGKDDSYLNNPPE